MSIKSPYRTIEESLIGWLQGPENAEAYLVVVLGDYIEGRDLRELLKALSFISIARGGALELNESTAVDQVRLDKVLGVCRRMSQV